SAVLGSHQSSVIDNRFSGAFTRGEGRRPAVGGIEELRAVSGAARGAELIPGQAAVARMQREEESAIAVEHLTGHRARIQIREVNRVEQPGSEPPGVVLGLERDRNAPPRGAAVRGREDSADVATRAPVKIAYQPSVFRVDEVDVAEAEVVIR